MGETIMRAGPEGACTLEASGDFGIDEVSGLREDMLGALDACTDRLFLDFGGVTSVDMLFFQLLFSLASQAGLDGKRVVFGVPLPEPLRRAAGELGIAQRDFDQAFSSKDDQ